MTDVSPRLLDKQSCPCGCGQYGVLGRSGHVRNCPDTCPKCRGRRNRKRGLAKQREARKQLGVTGGSDEEHWADSLFANEVKSGRQANPAATVFLRIEAQVFAARADHGDRLRPCRAVLMPEHFGSEGLVIVRLSVWDELVRPALEGFYG